MNYNEAVRDIKQGVKPVYLLTGEETYQITCLKDMIIRAAMPESERSEVIELSTGEINEILQLVESVPFFTSKNVVVVRNPSFLKEKKKKKSERAEDDGSSAADKNEAKLLERIADMPEYSVLIFIVNEKVDKRRRLYKTIAKAGMAAELNPIRAWEVKDWLMMRLRELGVRFDNEAVQYFIGLTSVMNTISLGYLNQELEKLLLYTDKPVIGRRELEATMAACPEVSVFAMLDAISGKQTMLALELLNDQLASGEHPLKMILMLSRHVRQLWQLQVFMQQKVPVKKIAAEIGMVPFLAEKLAPKVRYFSGAQLKKAFVDLTDADYRFKKSQADSMLLEQIIIELCQ